MTDLTYVIADLHGRSDLLHLATEAITKHSLTVEVGSRTVVTLGDYVDRGPDSRGVIEQLMLGAAPGWQLVCLCGNHEQMMLAAVYEQGGEHWRCWIMNGGDATARSYPDQEIPWEHLRWMANLPVIHHDQHRIYVHADVNPHAPLDAQDPDVLLWSRHRFGRNMPGKHIIVGHTPDDRNPRTADGRTDLDTCAYETGRLAVAIFDDNVPGGPYGFLHVQGASGARRVIPDAILE